MPPYQQEKIIKMMKEEYTLKKANCDKYDYLLASVSGILSGLIDVFLVGNVNNPGKISAKVDKQSADFVEKFSDFLISRDSKYKNSNLKKPDTLSKKVSYLEKRFQVPYDAISDGQIGQKKGTLDMNTKNHHYISIAHSPGIEGLIFSIIDQFTGGGTYFSNGKIITGAKYDKKEKFILQGDTFLEKIFYGTVNWIGHLISDLIGSNSSVSSGYRGTGLPIPLTQFFQLFDQTKIFGSEDDIATLARQAFSEGYDFRFGVALSIPVLINELIIRFLWSLKQYFYHKKAISDIIKTKNSPELRRMLLVGHGSLCIIDGGDAVLRSPGNLLGMYLSINIVAWTRLATISFSEIKARYGSNFIDKEKRDSDMDLEWEKMLTQ